MANIIENSNSENELIELENQLSCPKGEFGIEVGNLMNEKNIMMTLNSIDFLEIKNNNYILEIGHGNCGHLDKLLEVADNINYYGLEISETMRDEAQKNNLSFNAEFKMYNGVDIPFNDDFIDRILAVNTIYFWQNPIQLFKEIERTLKQGGIFVVTFSDSEYLKQFPFIKNKFQIYDRDRIENLVKETKLNILEFVNISDKIHNEYANTDERKYIMVKLNKV